MSASHPSLGWASGSDPVPWRAAWGWVGCDSQTRQQIPRQGTGVAPRVLVQRGAEMPSLETQRAPAWHGKEAAPTSGRVLACVTGRGTEACSRGD